MSAVLKDGGPAFPMSGSPDIDFDRGMSLRDYFAAKALLFSLELCRHDTAGYDRIRNAAHHAYQVADAMIEERGTTTALVSALPRFIVAEGPPASLAEMLTVNADDTDLCLWLRRAVPGDFYNGGGEYCRCVEG